MTNKRVRTPVYKQICPVCFEEETTPLDPRLTCQKCKEKLCSICIAKLITVCTDGCGCASYKCPTCRGDVDILIKDIVDPEMLHGLILKYRVMAKQGILDIHLGDGASSRGS